MNTKQGNRNIVQVYTRRNKNVGVLPVEQQVEQPQLVEQHVEHSQLLEQQQSSTSGIDISDSGVEQSIETGGEVDSSIDLPIALRKEARSTTGKPLVKYGFEHDISNYVSYESLSPAYRAFIASLQSTYIPRDWREAKQDPKWREATMEGLRALEKNKTWDIGKLPT